MPRYFVADRLFNGRGETADDLGVVVDGDWIVDVCTPENAPEGDRRRLPGHTLVPGLIDCHLHVSFDGSPDQDHPEMTTAERTLASMQHVQRSLMAGFTTLRVMGERSHLDVALQDAIDAGDVRGPRLIVAGQSLTATGGSNDYTFAHDISYDQNPIGVTVDGVSAFRRAAREQCERGVDLVKLVATGGLGPDGSPHEQHVAPAELAAAIGEADRRGVRTAAHCHGTAGIRSCLDAGVDTLEHGTYLHRDADLATQMVDEGVPLVPTLTVTDAILTDLADEFPPAYVEQLRTHDEAGKQSARVAREAGVTVVCGTDAGSPGNPHGENARELRNLVNAGLSEIEALRAATGNAASALGREEIGTLEPGRKADLVAARGNPLEDITALEDVSLVVKGGTVVRSDVEPD